jgi:ParB family chromosome partitioning protein
MITEIPLSQLVPSLRNVRKTGGKSIEDLAASIHAHGLLQNLVVSKDDRGKYQVEAGQRRHLAMQLLVKEDKLPAEYAVPCVVLGASLRDHTEASLAENVIRQDMHPADEFEAFRELIGLGHTVGDVAARFGKSEIYVKQRLKLANVAPDLLKTYRAGDATLEQMMALALTDDQALQERIWRGAKTSWQREPRRLREAITQKELAADSSLAKYIGLAAYEKAGGQVRRDIFGGDEDSFLMDAELAEKLALEKLERTAEKVRKEGWLWVEPRLKFEYYQHRDGFGNAPSEYKGSKETWSAEAKAHAGAIVSLGYNGQAEIKRGLVRPADRKAMAAATGEKVSGGKEKPAHMPGELSFAAVQRLQAEATGILRAGIAELPRTALALLAAELAGRDLYDFSIDYGTAQRQWIYIRSEHSGRMNGGLRVVMEQSAPGQRFTAAENLWKERLPKKKADLREWALAQDFDTIAKLLAFLAARELDLVDGSPDSKQGVVDAAEAAHVDLSTHWAPSEEWLATLPKAAVIAMVTDAAGKDAAAPLDKLKKAQLPQAAIGLFPAGWLPKPLRSKVAKKPAKPARKAKAPA